MRAEIVIRMDNRCLDKCKKKISSDSRGFYFHQCTRKIWKDGFCKIHHPESIEKKQKLANQRWAFWGL
jgi:hypothetical protein